MTLSLYRSVGGYTLPVTAAAIDEDYTLDTVDNAKRRLLALTVAAVNAELGGAWAVVVPHIPEMRGTTPVVDSYPYEPTAQRMAERSTRFPALYLHRSGELQYDELTVNQPRKTAPWSMHYILGPLKIGGISKLENALWIVPDIVAATLDNGGHPAYASGVPQFGEGAGGLRKATLVTASAGTAKFASDAPVYYACLMQLRTEELITEQEGTEAPYDGMGATYHVGDGQDMLHDALQTDTEIILQRS